MTKLTLGSCVWLPRTVGSIAKVWALPLSAPQIREKLQQVVSRRQEMNDKWEARSDRLHMCEYSSGLGNLRPLLEVAGTTPCLEETPLQYKALGPSLSGGRKNTCVDTCSTLLPLSTLLVTHYRPACAQVGSPAELWLARGQAALVSPGYLTFLFYGGEVLCPPAARG